MLANSLLEKGGDVELSEELPRVADSLRYVCQYEENSFAGFSDRYSGTPKMQTF